MVYLRRTSVSIIKNVKVETVRVGESIPHGSVHHFGEFISHLEHRKAWRRNFEDLTIDKDRKRQGFVTIISPLKAGKQASPAQEQAAIPAIPNTIPIHADMLMGASIIALNSSATWTIGGQGAVTLKTSPSMRTRNGKASSLSSALSKPVNKPLQHIDRLCKVKLQHPDTDSSSLHISRQMAQMPTSSKSIVLSPVASAASNMALLTTRASCNSRYS